MLRALSRAPQAVGPALGYLTANGALREAESSITALRTWLASGQLQHLHGASQASSNGVARQQSASSKMGWAATQARWFRSTVCAHEAIDVKVPAMGESVSEGTVANILKKPGDLVRENDIIAQIETDKVTIDVKYTGKEAGTVTALHIKEQEVVQVGKLVCSLDTTAGATAAAAAPAAPAAKPAAPKAEAPKAAPAAPKPPTPAPAAAKPAAPAADAGSGRVPGAPPPKPERRVKMTRLRQRVAERLKGAQNTYALLSTFNEVDMTSVIDMRNQYKDLFLEKHGVKLGFMSAFVKASAYALNEVPAVNAVIDGDEIVYRDYVDISIAVATPKGLVVPVLRSADKLNFAQVEKTMIEMGKKARDGTISIDDMAGGTFTISNGGVYGSMLSTPIINPPQSAILGMHAIVQRPMVVGGKIEARPMMNLALTYDHRLIDGREAVTFLKRIKEIIEDPRRLLIDC
mmetsp:Transcript_34789/g.88122  ORF Transcript_34789/g.88122 Transcript_34789/m.88122 type:complete len:461 (-) Transcript_34789:503-1885(-)